MKRPTGAELRSSPKTNQTVEKRSYQNDEAENLPRMDSALGVLLDGVAVKEKAEASEKLLNVESPSDPLDRGCLRPLYLKNKNL